MSLFAARTLARRGSELGKPRIVVLSHFACELGRACEPRISEMVLPM